MRTLEGVAGRHAKTWGNPRVIAEADRRKGEERWVTPRLSLLSDGRQAIICDHDDYSHYHEDQPSGIWIWFSSDRGQTWRSPRLTGVPGLEPDRVVELVVESKDGTL
ncbi:MAG: sialidase family protein, partial [Bryobacteraceae bacterium]